MKWQGWSGDNSLTKGTTILAGLKQEAAKAGATILTDEADAAQADAILLVVGEKPYAEGMGDSADISLMGAMALYGNTEAMAFARKSGKPVIALIVAGRQIMISDELPSWKAAVMAYLPGTEGEGIAPVLFGEKDFTGKLPMPWYKSVGDIGKQDAKLLFSMGYGLRYSK
jgi:beta-glucosidase